MQDKIFGNTAKAFHLVLNHPALKHPMMVAVFSSSVLCLLIYMDWGRKMSINIDEPLFVYDAKIAGIQAQLNVISNEASALRKEAMYAALI